MGAATFNPEKMYTYLHGYASGAAMKETLKALTFSVEKLKSYIEETRHYVLPLLRKVKNQYPEDSDILFVLKYHIVSVVDSIDATIQVFENEK